MRALIRNGAVTGYAHTSYSPPTGYVLADLPEGYTEADRELLVYADGVLTIDAAAALARAQAAAVTRIKAVASEQIDALAWRMERAKERDALALEGETPADVMLAREAIRRASNRAESEVMALVTLAAVQEHAWSVTGADQPTSAVESKLTFLRRLTPKERIDARAAAKADPGLADGQALLDAAEYVARDDPDTIGYVQYLESIEVLAPGRAAQVLGG